MDTLYDRILNLCKMNNMNITAMCKDAGVSRGSLTDLKGGRNKTLKPDTLDKIANYFDTTIDYLLGRTDDPENDDRFGIGISDEEFAKIEQKEKAPALTEKDKRDAAKEVACIMDALENSGELMFDGVPLSPEARESLAAAMKLGLEAARLKNKETYTPKKYRK